jgi:hypothetical protein
MVATNQESNKHCDCAQSGAQPTQTHKGVRMTRKFKTLGVALFAVLALTAVMASAASAAAYTSSTYPTTATGSSPKGNDVFTTEAGNVECASHFHVTIGGPPSYDVTVEPTYSGCEAFGFLEATVTGCKFTFTATSIPSSTVHVTGPCTIKAGTCHVTVDNQNNLGSVATTNNAAGDVSVQANVSGIKYTVINDGFLCPFNGTGEKTGATYKQGSAITIDAVNPATASISVS